MTNNKQLKNLISRLEKSKGPDRAIDGALATFLGLSPKTGKGPFDWKYKGNGVWHQAEFNQPSWGNHYKAPSFTSSIDAALTFIPDGWRREMVAIKALKENEE